ncbi:MAG: helix-turn-helix transcriptional regulator [Pseudomonadota bacterium]
MKTDLRRRRAMEGLSQKALGERVGVSRQAINAIETGKHHPSLDLAYRLTAVFRCQVEDLFENPYIQDEAP